MELSIVPRYAALLALLFLVLSVAVVRERGAQKVAIGAPPRGALERRVRVHGNFAEYAPFTLLLLAMAELRDAPPLLLHALCLALLAGRAAHAWGVSQTDEDLRFRMAGMALTFAALAGAALTLLLG